MPARGTAQVNARSKLPTTAVDARTLATMAREHLLIVEDDDAIASGLARVLDSQGYDVTRLARGRPALAAADRGVRLVILDLGLPDMDGIDACRALRRAHPELPILILSARDQELDVVAGLDAGADDYLVKPFKLSELLARVRAQLRRAMAVEYTEPEAPMEVGALRVDQGARRAWLADAELSLRPKEFDLLALLTAEAGRAVTRDRIMHEVWDTEWLGSTKTLDTHILALRNKLGAEAITTLRGVGYRLDLP
jgi:DNA-binding response OmpR family regulator